MSKECAHQTIRKTVKFEQCIKQIDRHTIHIFFPGSETSPTSIEHPDKHETRTKPDGDPYKRVHESLFDRYKNILIKEGRWEEETPLVARVVKYTNADNGVRYFFPSTEFQRILGSLLSETAIDATLEMLKMSGVAKVNDGEKDVIFHDITEKLRSILGTAIVIDGYHDPELIQAKVTGYRHKGSDVYLDFTDDEGRNRTYVLDEISEIKREGSDRFEIL